MAASSVLANAAAGIRLRNGFNDPCASVRSSCGTASPASARAALLLRGAGREGTRHRQRFAACFETALTQLDDGLARPRAHERLGQVWQRIGRLKPKHSRVAPHYQMAVTADETGEKAVAVTWTRRPQGGSMATPQGVYCLRSSETDWDEDALWRTHTTLPTSRPSSAP